MTNADCLQELLRAYTSTLLEYNLPGQEPAPLRPCANPARTAFLERCKRLAVGSKAEVLVLLGLADGELALRLHETSPHSQLLILEPQPQRLRELVRSNHPAARLTVIADSSIRALWLLGKAAIRGKPFITCLNPELPAAETEQAKTLQRLLIYAPEQSVQKTTAIPSLSLYLISHPDEPGLEDFFSQLPDWLAEVVIVWDSPQVPEAAQSRAASCPAPVRHAARPLGGDFAAQRNHALSLCTGDWIITLDADERLEQDSWQFLQREITAPRSRAYLLPRLTLYPDFNHFRVGYGLWPDPQLRLFCNTPGLKYIYPVHEILSGFAADPALLPHCPIIHHSYVAKDRVELRQRLEVFNQAAGHAAHVLSEDYPHLPLNWHHDWLAQIKNLSCLPLLAKA